MDVSGFTNITEQASARGHYGVELVTNVLNRYFAGINALIKPYQGEIAKFGGDACLILFPCQSCDALPDLELIISRIKERTAALDKVFRRQYGFSFHVHGAFGAGMVDVFVVGDGKRHLDYYVDSDAIRRVYATADKAGSTEILAAGLDPFVPPSSTSALTPNPCSAANALKFLPADVQTKLDSESNPAELRAAAILFIKLSSVDNGEIALAEYDDCYRRLQAVVSGHKGVINKIDRNEKGCLILALFGAPYVYGNDARRAFTAAYRLSVMRCTGVQMQIGITYSTIFCGNLGSSARWEYGIIGNAVNIAARLMSFARPGEVCLSEEIIPRLEGLFETAWIAKTKVKGIAGDIDIHRLIKQLPQSWQTYRSRFASVLPDTADPHLTAIRTALSGSSGCLVSIIGASGTGKSLYVWKSCEYLMADNAQFNLLSADPYVRGLRLEIFFLTLRSRLDIANFRDDFPILLQWCHERGMEFDADLLRRVLFAPEPANPERARQEADLAMEIILRVMTAFYPHQQALIVDNYHFFDPQSQLILQRLIAHNLYAGGKVLISSETPLPDNLSSHDNPLQITLANWDAARSTAFIRRYLPNVSRKGLAALHRLSHGNPQFLSELVNHLHTHFAAQDDLITDDVIKSMLHQGLLPDSLENLFRADFENLASDLQRLARLASIYGRPFAPDELDAIFAMPAGSSEALSRQLVQRGIFRLNAEAASHSYAYLNPILQESIYRSILMGEKVNLHTHIAQYHEKTADEQDERLADLIAHHYTRAVNKAGIRRWCSLLARRHYAAGALELSLRYWQDVAAYPENNSVRAEARLNCAEILLLLADNASAKDILDGLGAYSKKPGILRDRLIYLRSRHLVNTAAIPELNLLLDKHLPTITDPDIRAMLSIDLCEALLNSGDPQRFAALALPLYEQFQAEGKDRFRSSLSGIIGAWYFNRGEYGASRKYYQEKMKLAYAAKDPVGLRISLSGIGNSHSRAGNKTQALKFFRAALEVSEKSGDRNGYSKALLNIGVIHRNNGEYDAAFECYEKSLRVAQFSGNRQQISIIVYDMGELRYYQERYAEAEVLIRQSLDIALQIGDHSGMSFCYDALGDIAFRNGDYTAARQIYLDNLKMQYRIKDVEGMAHSIGNLGNIAKTESRYAVSERYYRRQIDLLSTVNDIDGTGRAWFNLAMLDIEQDKPAAARLKLQQALELFLSCGAQYYADFARQQLEQLGE